MSGALGCIEAVAPPKNRHGACSMSEIDCIWPMGDALCIVVII